MVEVVDRTARRVADPPMFHRAFTAWHPVGLAARSGLRADQLLASEREVLDQLLLRLFELVIRGSLISTAGASWIPEGCRELREPFVLSHSRSPRIAVRQGTRLSGCVTRMTINEQDNVVGVRDDKLALNPDRADQLLRRLLEMKRGKAATDGDERVECRKLTPRYPRGRRLQRAKVVRSQRP